MPNLSDNENPAILTLENISCEYHGKAVLKDMTLTVEHNEILCLLGPSGCGKTTALKAIAGLMPTKSGQMKIAGKIVNDSKQFMPPESRNLGMIFQDYALFPHLTVAANVGFAIRHQAKETVKQQVDTMLALVKLEGLGDRYPHQLSGGQQQRVSIARALAYSPRLLLLDEPFSNIDTQVRLSLIEDIREILKSQQMSAVFVTHSKEEGFAFADTMAVMNDGVIVQQDTPEHLFNHPNSSFVAEFLGKGVYLDAKVVSENQISTDFGVLTSTTAVNFAVNTQGRLFVRPQYFDLSASSEAAGVEARIVHKQFVGSGFNYQLEYQSQQIDVFSAKSLPVNDLVKVAILPHQLHLFVD